MIFLYISTLVCCAIAYIWYRVSRTLSYWSDKNVPVIEPKFPMGNLGDVGKKHFGCVLKDIYLELKDKGEFAGLYFLLSPEVMLLNLELIKTILIKDFQYFTDRKIYYNEKDDPLSAHLFAIRGEKWRVLRQQLTPTFTTGKMKMMFPLIISKAKYLQKYIQKHLNGKPIQFKHVCTRFTADVIANAAFGLDCRALVEEDAEIVRIGKLFFSFNTFFTRFQFFFGITCGNLCRKLGFRFNHPDMEEFFMRIIKETVEQREAGLIDRNDFMKHLLEIKNSGKGGDIVRDLTFNELAAQAFVIFFGGFETSSTTMEWFLSLLAQHPEIQERARAEVKDVMERWNGELTYEAIQELTYLRQCIDETLRIYPPAVNLFRLCVKDYKLPNSDYIVKKDTQVIVPVLGIHMDPDIYPNPEVFDPDRFTPDNMRSRHAMAYLPFGDGPRNCIGLRFGLMQMTVGLAYILHHFRFTLNPKTQTPLQMDPSAIVVEPEGGVWLDVEEIITKIPQI